MKNPQFSVEYSPLSVCLATTEANEESRCAPVGVIRSAAVAWCYHLQHAA